MVFQDSRSRLLLRYLRCESGEDRIPPCAEGIGPHRTFATARLPKARQEFPTKRGVSRGLPVKDGAKISGPHKPGANLRGRHPSGPCRCPPSSGRDVSANPGLAAAFSRSSTCPGSQTVGVNCRRMISSSSPRQNPVISRMRVRMPASRRGIASSSDVTPSQRAPSSSRARAHSVAPCPYASAFTTAQIVIPDPMCRCTAPKLKRRLASET